jgi:hypothetical protein
MTRPGEERMRPSPRGHSERSVSPGFDGSVAIPGYNACVEKGVLVGYHTERGNRSVRGVATNVNGNNMTNSSKKSAKATRSSAVPDIDFAGGIRGKYAARYAESTNIVVLSPEIAAVFPNSEAVNEALRTLVRLSGKTVRVTPATRTPKARG